MKKFVSLVLMVCIMLAFCGQALAEDKHMTFGNIGQAPMYWDWPVSMYIYDRTGTCIRVQTLDLKLSDLLPGQTVTVTGTVPYSRSLLEGYTVGLAIRSPEGETVTLAQKGVLPDADGIHRVYRSKKIR